MVRLIARFGGFLGRKHDGHRRSQSHLGRHAEGQRRLPSRWRLAVPYIAVTGKLWVIRLPFSRARSFCNSVSGSAKKASTRAAASIGLHEDRVDFRVGAGGVGRVSTPQCARSTGPRYAGQVSLAALAQTVITMSGVTGRSSQDLLR